MLSWRHKDVLDNGLAYIKTYCNAIAIINYAYARGDSYATVRGTADANIIVEKTGLTSSDFTLADYSTYDRKLTSGTYSATAVKTSSGVSGNLGFALLDTVNSKVLAVCDEASSPERTIILGDTVNFPAIELRSLCPTT